MNIVRYLSFLLVLSMLAVFPTVAISGQTLTCGGAIADAPDATSADGAFWFAYKTAEPGVFAQGTVGSFLSGYWAGEVGHFLQPVSISDELLVIVEKETDAGVEEHRGYYATTDMLIGPEDPALFPPMVLRPVPAPAVSVEGENVTITWQAAQEDGSDDIAGYNLYRSADGILFDPVNTSLIGALSYTDPEFAVDTKYYAIGLAYRGSQPVWGSVLSSNSNSAADIDNDSDGLRDLLELLSCTGNQDADTDDDGIADGLEDADQNGEQGENETSPCKSDSDGDGIQDGTERGLILADIGPDTDLEKFQEDSDPSTKTDPLNPDSDYDGLNDGEEDINKNGIRDDGELDPLDADTDDDGAMDGLEIAVGDRPPGNFVVAQDHLRRRLRRSMRRLRRGHFRRTCKGIGSCDRQLFADSQHGGSGIRIGYCRRCADRYRIGSNRSATIGLQ